ncbi:dienelactone hydrolase family protein [Roseomonas sp. WA12]
MHALLTRPIPMGPVPAAILVPDALGLDQRLAAIANRLVAEGWATLEVDLAPVSADGHEPPGPSSLAMQADAGELVSDLALLLEWLSEEPGIDAGRIAVVGLGTGGRAALLAGSEEAMTLELGTFGARFAAHFAFYPGCGALLAEGFTHLSAWSSAPLAVLQHGQDDSSACNTLNALLAVQRRPAALWHEYRTATYAWDIGLVVGHTPIRLANLGSSPLVVTPDQNMTEDATGRLVQFLRQVLGPLAQR